MHLKYTQRFQYWDLDCSSSRVPNVSGSNYCQSMGLFHSIGGACISKHIRGLYFRGSFYGRSILHSSFFLSGSDIIPQRRGNMASGTITNPKALIALNVPTYVYRPISGNQTSNWTYTVEQSGILMLTFSFNERSYIPITVNNAAVATIAMTGGAYAEITTISIPVVKGQVVAVTNLTGTSYIIGTSSALIAYPYQPT